MEKQKKKWYEKLDDAHQNFMIKSPFIYNIYWIVYMVTIGGCLFLLYIILKPIPFEMEGSCNTGFIGIDFSERFVFNETNPLKPLLSYNPQKLDLKNINGLNCNFRVKGEMPLDILRRWLN